jgi:hypothetical protein
MRSWTDINAKKYGEKAMVMIQAANLNLKDFVQESDPSSFRLVYLPTQDYFAFGDEDGGASWTWPGYPGKTSQTGSGAFQSWDSKIRYFEVWLGKLQEFLAASAGATGPPEQDAASHDTALPIPRSATPGSPEAAPAPNVALAAEPNEVQGSAPEDRLSRFMQAHPGTSYADIKYSAVVHTPEFQDWRKGKLGPKSVMSVRIENVLNGISPLKKKPSKSRAD